MNPQLLLRIHSRTAWLVLLGCGLLWAAASLNLLEPGVGTPPMTMLLIFYFVLLAIILSLVLAIGAAAALVLHRQENRNRPEAAASRPDTPAPIRTDREASAPARAWTRLLHAAKRSPAATGKAGGANR